MGRGPEADSGGKVEDLASIEVKAPELCPRFTARVFTGVKVGPSPLWMKAHLIAAGQRPINNVVDITNFAMLAIGQPMHAYDLDKVGGGKLVVDTAKKGEKLTTLDGVERTFNPDGETDHVLIYDADGPTGIAGIMGGASSEVSPETTTVLLEVANWDGVNILRTSRILALRSEASARFEKQLHPELAMRAQSLLRGCWSSSPAPRWCRARSTSPPRSRTRIVIELRAERISSLLGIEIAAEKAAADLERLGFGVKRKGRRR